MKREELTTSGYSKSLSWTTFNAESQSWSRSLHNSGSHGCPISVPLRIIICLAVAEANRKKGLKEKRELTTPVARFMAAVPSSADDDVASFVAENVCCCDSVDITLHRMRAACTTTTTATNAKQRPLVARNSEVEMEESGERERERERDERTNLQAKKARLTQPWRRRP
jgi:hypothetical protein